MTNVHLCPKCGKPMVEATKWPGLWQCPDYIHPIGKNGAGYIFKCDGLEITDEGADGFDAAIYKLIAESN